MNLLPLLSIDLLQIVNKVLLLTAILSDDMNLKKRVPQENFIRQTDSKF